MRLLYHFLAAVLLLLLTATSSLASMDQFAGYWTNVDPNTGGITNLDIAVTGTSAQVHGWGKCHPTDCDWGTVTAYPFTSDVSSDMVSTANALLAVFDSGFSETTLVIRMAGENLQVDSYDRFKDNSGRTNYLASYTFQRGQAPGSTTPGGIIPGGTLPGGVTPGTAPSSIDLTGVWNCDDGGKYYVRQLGPTVWWYGEHDPNTPDWSNVMRGTISVSTISADWTDVPKGSIMQHGALTLHIESNNRVVAISKTGGFVGSVWTR